MGTLTNISPSYKGNRILLYGKFAAMRVPNSVTVENRKSSANDNVEILKDKASHFPANTLHRLVAGKFIREFEKRQIAGEDMKERIINLAVKNQLVSKFTSSVGNLVVTGLG